MPVIYIDILFALNLWIDFLILMAVARLLRRPYRRWRLLLSAAAGAALACVVFLSELPWVAALLLRVVGSVLMVGIGFRWVGAKRFAFTVAALELASAVFAGAVLAVWLVLRPNGLHIADGVVYYDISPLILALLTAATYAVLCAVDHFTGRRVRENGTYYLHVRAEGQTVRLQCMYDSGHHLKEPFSGRSVIVADMDAVLPVCPAAVPDWLCGGKGDGVRVIPYRTVGGGGLLPAFCPEQVVLSDSQGRKQVLDGVYIAVTDALHCGDCHAIIGKELVQLFT